MNVSSYYSTGGVTHSNNGLSGLASGIDTDEMVEQMLAGTQGKIDAQEALKQQELWKQEIYRDIITEVNTFHSSYFDKSYGATATNNLANADFFNTMSSVLKAGSGLNIISTDSSALTEDMKVAIKQLASAASMSSDVKMSTGNTIDGEALDLEAIRQELTVQVDVKVGDTTVNVAMGGMRNQDQVVDAFNTAFENAGVTGVEAKLVDGALRIVTDDPTQDVEILSTSTELGLELTGLTSVKAEDVTDVNGTITGNMVTGSREINPIAGPSITLSLDGISKTIALNDVTDGSGVITEQSIADAIAREATNAFGNVVTVDLVDVDGGKALSLGIDFGGEPGHELRITGADANLLGITPGDSTSVNTNTKLSELAGVSGDRFSFTINGEEFTFSGDQTVGNVINEINNSNIGVRMTFSSTSDTFKLESSSTGAAFGIEVNQSEGNLLSAMFGSKIAAGSSIASDALTTKSIASTPLDSSFTAEYSSFSFTVNGESYTHSIARKENDAKYSSTELIADLNGWLEEEFGTDSAGNANIRYAEGELKVAEGFVVEFSQTTVDTEDGEALKAAMQTDLALALGFKQNASSNIATADTAVSDIVQFNGATVNGATLGDVTNINGTIVESIDGRIVMSGSGDLNISANAVLAEIFDSATLSFGDGTAAADAVDAGTNAVFEINGTETSRASNTFTIDGITMELTAVSESTIDASGTAVYEEAVIGTTRNVDSIVEGITKFVEDYNAMLDKLNGYIYEEASYRDYDPLTTAQRQEMSDSEIELWEEKAKEGLVRNDNDVASLLNSLRTALYTKPDSSDLALYDIGIETMDYEQRGKLEIDEAALREALASDPESVKNLFTDSVDGIATQFIDIMDRAADMSSGSPGTLVSLAGVVGTATAENNTIYDNIQSIEERIADLMDKYETEKERYWAQFTEMETVISNYSSQSSYLASYFAY